jgi:hypothetical protein
MALRKARGWHFEGGIPPTDGIQDA